MHFDFTSSQTGTFHFLLFIFNYFFTPLARYSQQDGLSVLSDIIWWSVLLIIIVQTALHYSFPWKQTFNILTVGGIVLAAYCFLEIVNPTASFEAWIYSRGFIYNTFLVSLITVLLATSYKQVNRLIFLFSILTLVAILKGFYQKFIGFDAIEYNAIMESGMYKTHLLSQITRYFPSLLMLEITALTWDSRAYYSASSAYSARSSI